jgi:hypothetical protein
MISHSLITIDQLAGTCPIWTVEKAIVGPLLSTLEAEHSSLQPRVQSYRIGAPPRLDFEAWRDLLRSNCGGEVKVTAPGVFAGWMRPLNACGLAAASVRMQWGSADLGCHAHRFERIYRDARLDGTDHYLIVFQVAGQSAMIQADRAAQLAAGDVALVDAARPVDATARAGTGKSALLAHDVQFRAS